MEDAPAPSVTFDAEGHVHLLAVEASEATSALSTSARAFVAKVQEFSGSVHTIVEGMGRQAASIEHAKLKAIGQRNAGEALREQRSLRQEQLQSLLTEATAELARLTAEYESLQRIEAAQKDMMDKLGLNEAGGI